MARGNRSEWVGLCNGQNGTPNLQGQFILGASQAYSAGSTGGEVTHTLNVGEMPSHSHASGLALALEDIVVRQHVVSNRRIIQLVKVIIMLIMRI